jgi:hypothetical protein
MYKIGAKYSFQSNSRQTFYTGTVLAEDELTVKILDKTKTEVILPKAGYTATECKF